MIVDRIKNLHLYPNLVPFASEIQSFLKKAESGLPDGKYLLDGENLFALVQHYTSKPMEEGHMEAHFLYADLQCVLSGQEYIYVDYAEDLTITDDRRPDSDVVFFKDRPHKGGNLIEAGCFGYYAPSDAHHPGVTVEGPEDNFKVVFKIKL